MTFEIVNHSHNYPRLLAYQLSSLVLHPPRTFVFYSLYCDADDAATRRVTDYFTPRLPPTVSLDRRPMSLDHLRNRAIGRNHAAMNTRANWVLFVDTDYALTAGFWPSLAAATWTTTADLLWPRAISQTDWPTGDALLAEMHALAVRDVPLAATTPQPWSRAIGGMQIVRGDYARANGYCPGDNKPSATWRFGSDVRFRRSIARREAADITGVVRIRHYTNGYTPGRELVGTL